MTQPIGPLVPSAVIVGAGAWQDCPPGYRAPSEATASASCVGIDLSYSGTGDRAACVAVSVRPELPDVYYVREAWSGPRELRDLRRVLLAWVARYPDAPLASFVSGTEARVLGLLSEESRDAATGERFPGVTVVGMMASESKAARAAATAEAWNAGRVILPRGAPWVDRFVRSVQTFSGRDGEHDDEVDALVSAVEFLRRNAISFGDAGGPVAVSRTAF